MRLNRVAWCSCALDVHDALLKHCLSHSPPNYAAVAEAIRMGHLEAAALSTFTAVRSRLLVRLLELQQQEIRPSALESTVHVPSRPPCAAPLVLSLRLPTFSAPRILRSPRSLDSARGVVGSSVSSKTQFLEVARDVSHRAPRKSVFSQVSSTSIAFLTSLHRVDGFSRRRLRVTTASAVGARCRRDAGFALI
jgi:hypothetical protein